MRMRRFGLVLGAAVAFAAARAAAKPANQCVVCHQTEILPMTLGHSFPEWKGSAHGRAGVGCQACHGGDPAAKSAAAAHAGLLPAAEPASRVHGRNLPITCGSCHAAEQKAFDASLHGQALARDGKGATCALCHGAMATSLPSPAELDARCAACHTKPVDAQAALAVMGAAKIKLFRVAKDLGRPARKEPAWKGSVRDRLHEHERSYRKLQEHWHSFQTRAVLEEGRDLLKLAEALAVELKARK